MLHGYVCVYHSNTENRKYKLLWMNNLVQKPVTFFQAAQGINNNSGSIWRSMQSVCGCIQKVLDWRRIHKVFSLVAFWNISRALSIWKAMKRNHPIKIKGHPLLDHLLQKWPCLSPGSFTAHSWSAPQASPLGKSSHWSSQAWQRQCLCFPYSQLTQHPTGFGWFVAAPRWLVFALCSDSVNYDTSSSFSLFWPGSLVQENAVCKCGSDTVWCYLHRFVKTFHKPSQLEVGLTLSSSRGEVLCHGQCKQGLSSAEINWAN